MRINADSLLGHLDRDERTMKVKVNEPILDSVNLTEWAFS